MLAQGAEPTSHARRMSPRCSCGKGPSLALLALVEDFISLRDVSHPARRRTPYESRPFSCEEPPLLSLSSLWLRVHPQRKLVGSGRFEAERSAKLPGPLLVTLSQEKPEWRPRSAAAPGWAARRRRFLPWMSPVVFGHLRRSCEYRSRT